MFSTICFQFVIAMLCLGLFLKGYFPVKQGEIFEMNPPDQILDRKLNLTAMYKPEIDRLVLIVIDALRVDFVTSDFMPYTYAEKSCLLKVKVESPTVTLPRIKALTTGDVPQFADIILNLGAASKCTDSFLHRAHKVGKKLVFYGDDTWIKIYPEVFLRKEGTNSFFVNDFYEVDNNVTRNIDEEMKKRDWDIMILHYLGLDHIGHVQGPFSSLVKPKLDEMDAVVKTINEASKTWNKRTLILITGDHGMKDSGGHGGTTYAESHVPLVSFGSSCDTKNTLISQTDIPTTLSTLFGIEIPTNSIGQIVPAFFTSVDMKRVLYILYYNLIILRRHLNECNEDFLKAIHLHYNYLYNNASSDTIYNLYSNCLNTLSNKLIETSIEQNLKFLIFSGVMSITCLLKICNTYMNTNINHTQIDYIAFCITVLFYFNHNIHVSWFAIAITFSIYLCSCNLKIFITTNFNILFISIILHAVLLQSSSFIEEEHLIYYFYTSTASLVFAYSFLKKSLFDASIILSILTSLRFLRTINSTGDKWASHPDLADWFILNENFHYLQLFYAVSLILILLILIYLNKINFINSVFLTVTVVLIYVFKLYYIHSVGLAQVIWVLIGLIMIRQLFSSQNFCNKFIISWLLIITLLIRPFNAILIPACIAGSHIYNKYVKNINVLIILHIWLGYSLFFCQGHSNSIASIDLAPAYVGLSRYIPSIVFPLTLCHTYAFPILSFILLLEKNIKNINEIFVVNLLYRLLILVVIYIVVFLQRGHLFVWSVFAPKLLIESVHISMLFIELMIYVVLSCTNKILIKFI